MRSFLSKFLQGKRYKKKADRQKVFKAAHDAYKEFSSAEGDIAQYNIAQNRSVGIAGTESYRHCGDGFGCKRQRSGQACAVGKRRRLRDSSALVAAAPPAGRETAVEAIALSSAVRRRLGDLDIVPLGVQHARGVRSRTTMPGA